jgi:hypothetical protein
MIGTLTISNGSIEGEGDTDAPAGSFEAADVGDAP